MDAGPDGVGVGVVVADVAAADNGTLVDAPALFDPSVYRAAVEALAALGEGENPDLAFLEKHCGNVIAAIAAMCDWLQA
ncbi:MAG: hypothetical protein KY410_03965 [Proteobacteria bacterium]|nr:hypothetical protein [Pseudomonadota bacterium]